MRTLLSTRLFAARPLEEAPLRLALEYGFPELEIFGLPTHLDVLDLGQVQRAAGLLARMGFSAPWLHIGPSVLNRLGDERCLVAFGDAVQALRLRAVVADTRAFGVRQDGALVDLHDLAVQVQSSGARLLLDVGRFDERSLGRMPTDLGLCWDIASPQGEAAESSDEREEEERQELRRMLGSVARGRLLGVRVAAVRQGRRVPPDCHEALVLEELWRAQGPGALVYDVDDPGGQGSEPEIRRALEAIRSFHAGEKRPHPESSGGVFWASMAPG